MTLELFSSKRGVTEPNLVAIQAADLDMIPTVLVCPIIPGEKVTSLRTEVTHGQRRYTVLCELARPINRRGGVKVGILGERDSQRIMSVFALLLAR